MRPMCWNEWIYCSCLTLLFVIKLATSIDEMEYLAKYGYLQPFDKNAPSLISLDHYKKAVENFQRKAGLPVTGQLDPETKKIMQLPRCGVKDLIGTGNRARRKRYALHGSRWHKREITYKIEQESRKLPKAEVERELQKAFDIWGEVIPVDFKRKSDGPVDIKIRFVSGHHGDNTPFDGNGQTLAHAYFPQYGGDAHFDEDERWTFNIHEGVNLFQVAAHEFGHSLGLAHSDVRSALMTPYYRGFDSNFKLDLDDIQAVQELYGTKEHPSITTRKPYEDTERQFNFFDTNHRTPADIPKICRNATVDAITRTDNGHTYLFSGDNYYRLSDKGFDPAYPRAIKWDWGNVETPIDAALSWPTGWTFLFKGNHYWKYRNMQMIYGPKNISEGFDGISSDLDAAFVWSGNGKTYFIKGDVYWRYYGNKIDHGYPKNMSVWRGLPQKITSAFQWRNGVTYFFSGDKYYRYNDQQFNVSSAGYPRDVAYWWLGCPDKDEIAEIDRRNDKRKNGYFPFNGKQQRNDTLVISVTGYSENSGLKGIHNGACAFRTSGAVGVLVYLTTYILANNFWGFS